MEMLGTRLHTAMASHPQGNGLVERTHRWLKEALNACGGDWSTALPWVLLGLWNTPRDDDDVSAAEILYRVLCVLLGTLVDAPELSDRELLDAFERMKDCPPVNDLTFYTSHPEFEMGIHKSRCRQASTLSKVPLSLSRIAPDEKYSNHE